MLGTLTAGSNINITNKPGSITISTTGGTAPTLPYFVTGGPQIGAFQGFSQNVTELWGFLLPYNVTTTQITYDVTTADNSPNDYDIGIFDNSGNLVVNIGPTPGTTFAPSKAFHTAAWTQGSTSLPAGRYYLGLTTNCSITLSSMRRNRPAFYPRVLAPSSRLRQPIWASPSTPRLEHPTAEPCHPRLRRQWITGAPELSQQS